MLVPSLACGRIQTPIPSVERSLSPEAESDTLIIFLPGFSDRSSDYLEHEFDRQLYAAGIEADAIFLDAHFGYYRRGLIGPRVLHEVIEPARAEGKSIWIVGISMGGVGALLSARDAKGVDGLVLMSPYLGRPKTVGGIIEAGGVDAWTPPAEEGQWDEELWRWIAEDYDRSTPLYVGWGDQEENSVPNFELIASLAGPDHVFVESGPHEWTTWEKIWPKVLAAGAFRGPGAAGHKAGAEGLEGAEATEAVDSAAGGVAGE